MDLNIFLPNILAAIASPLVLGGIKAVTRNTGLWDRKIGAVIKPFQPYMVAGLSIALPLLGQVLGTTDMPTAEAVATAPSTALASIFIREVYSRQIGPLLKPISGNA